MRRMLILLAIMGLTSANAGCLINQYSSDPNERMQQLLNESENLRQAKNEWFRFWMIDQPSHLTPVRTHGGLSP